MCQETENLELIAHRYKMRYKDDFGFAPKFIFLSRRQLEKYEKQNRVEKLETILGMKVFSHTYPGEKYRFI